MSVAEFSQTLRDRIFSKFNQISSRELRADYAKLVDSEKFRKKYESAKQGASSVITESSLNKLIVELSQDITNDTLRKATEKFLKSLSFDKFISFVQSTSYYQNLVSRAPGEFRLESVPQATLRNLFLDYVDIELSNFGLSHATEVAIHEHISQNIQSGHLAGVFTLRLKEALFLNVTSTGATYRDFKLDLGDGVDKESIDTLERIMKVVLDADYLTSHIVDQEHLFAKATKTVLGDKPHLEVELQYTKANKAAGDLLASTGKYLNELIKIVSSKTGRSDNDATESFKKLVISLKPLSEVVIAKAAELQNTPSSKELADLILGDARALNQLASSLINTKGSPSIVESIGKNIANIVKTGKVLEKVTTTVTTNLSKTSKDKEIEQLNTTLKEVGKALKKVQSVIQKQNKISGSKAGSAIQPSATLQRMPSLTSLQAYINEHLQSVVSANMGGGTERSVLNYRTGRFAESVKVDNLSQSRQGMITAFYTYMKNPYQTFEPGFKQGSPKSRDPKLLISKSLREIVATKVSNKLRAQAL
jgi:hypothetical protein